MNVKWMLVPAVLATISLVADAVEPAHVESAQNAGWTQKEFIITFWCPPPATDQALAAVAAEHYNLTWVPAEGLDVAAKHKLRAMLTSDLLNPATLDDAAKRAQLDALIEAVKKHPALEAYYITDEPGRARFPASVNWLPTSASATRPISRTSTSSPPTRAKRNSALVPTPPSGPRSAIHRTSPASGPATRPCWPTASTSRSLLRSSSRT